MAKERPILMSGAMVRACLREVDPKTQTRRVVGGLSKRYPLVNLGQYGAPFSGEMNDPMSWGWAFAEEGSHMPLGQWIKEVCPYGEPGDRLWVRETWRQQGSRSEAAYRADTVPETDGFKWKPSIFMPRWACRLVLEVTGVRVERVQEISTWDCEQEGCGHVMPKSAQQVYRELWDSLNAKRGYGWTVNPWVWVVEFRRVR